MDKKRVKSEELEKKIDDVSVDLESKEEADAFAGSNGLCISCESDEVGEDVYQ